MALHIFKDSFLDYYSSIKTLIIYSNEYINTISIIIIVVSY